MTHLDAVTGEGAVRVELTKSRLRLVVNRDEMTAVTNVFLSLHRVSSGDELETNLVRPRLPRQLAQIRNFVIGLTAGVAPHHHHAITFDGRVGLELAPSG